jgi:hypothetical protein
LSKYTILQLQEAVAESISYTDVCKKLNITVCTFNFKKIQSTCQANQISLAHFDMSAALSKARRATSWSFDEVFCANSQVPRFRLRPLAIRFGLYTGTCNICNVPDKWNGNPLTLELDHIDGINDNNVVSNLRWLCPNCHSQTPTYRNPTNRSR